MVKPFSSASLLRDFAALLADFPSAACAATGVVVVELLLTIFLGSVGALGATDFGGVAFAFEAVLITCGFAASRLLGKGACFLLTDFLLTDFLLPDWLTDFFLTAAFVATLAVDAIFFGVACFDAAFRGAAFLTEGLPAAAFFGAARLAAGLLGVFADFLAAALAGACLAGFLPALRLPTLARLTGFALLVAMMKLVLFGPAGACYSLSAWHRQPRKTLD